MVYLTDSTLNWTIIYICLSITYVGKVYIAAPLLSYMDMLKGSLIIINNDISKTTRQIYLNTKCEVKTNAYGPPPF